MIKLKGVKSGQVTKLRSDYWSRDQAGQGHSRAAVYADACQVLDERFSKVWSRPHENFSPFWNHIRNHHGAAPAVAAIPSNVCTSQQC